MNPYKCMYVIPEEKYNALINQSQSSPIQSPSSSVDNLHSPFQSHSTRFRCNICKKSFKDEQHLRLHLKAHKPQVADIQPQRTEYPTEVRYGVQLQCSVCNKPMKHKRNLLRYMKTHSNSIKFKFTKWETLN